VDEQLILDDLLGSIFPLKKEASFSDLFKPCKMDSLSESSSNFLLMAPDVETASESAESDNSASEESSTSFVVAKAISAFQSNRKLRFEQTRIDEDQSEN